MSKVCTPVTADIPFMSLKIGGFCLGIFVLDLLCKMTHQHFSQNSSEFTPCSVWKILKMLEKERKSALKKVRKSKKARVGWSG